MNPQSLPTLIVNRSFMQAFLAANQPCCALGIVEVEQVKRAFVALCPETAIPGHSIEQGFSFGHALIGDMNFEVVHFGFEFYGYQTYNVLLNPNNEIVRRVLRLMIETGDYFFFALDKTSGSCAAFRSDLGTRPLSNLIGNWERIVTSTTTERQYLEAAIYLVKNPHPQGELLQWVCGDNLAYLDLSLDRLQMRPG